MNKNFLKNFYNVKLNSKNSGLSFFSNKSSFLDCNLSSINDIFLELSNIGKKEYLFRKKDFYNSLQKNENNNIIILNNGIMLINNLFEKVRINTLIFLRLKNPITYNDNSKLDIIFALITPKNIKTGPKLQMLSILSRILKKPNIRKKIRSAEKAEDVLALLLPSI